MSKEDQQQREVLALVSWLQTFDQFPYSVVDGLEGENVSERFGIVLDSLENVKISNAVVQVAEEVCDMQKIEIQNASSADNIWQTLLHLTSNKSRFEIYTTPNNVKSASELPHVVLSNLLDFAVTSPDLDDRRKYIERIMSLSKSVQKILMSLIERMKKTLPRKPKTPTPFSKTARNAKAMCGVGPQDNCNINDEGPDAPIPATSASTLVQKCSAGMDPLMDDDYSEDNSENTPQQENPQRIQSFTTPKRERNVHGVPQSEPKESSRGRSTMINAPHSDHKPSSAQRYPSLERQRKHDSDDPDASKPRQPEGYFLSEQRDKKRCQIHKSLVSPPRDRQRKQKGFASPHKRHSTGGSSGLPLPFRERQVQTQRAAFVSVNQHPSTNGKHGALSTIGGIIPPTGPPPPPPPYPASQLNTHQKMPAAATPSDELEIDNRFSIQTTETTTSTMTGGSIGSSTELALKLNSSSTDRSTHNPHKLTGKLTGKSMLADKKRNNEGFSTPRRRPSLTDSPGSSVPKTPEISLAMYERDVQGQMMLSPDESMLQSPMQVDDFVKELRAKNKSLESILQSYQKRERELSQKMESTESKLRKEMMKLESRALGREDELRRNYDNEVAKLKKDLRSERERNKESKKAKEELANANDELDLMQHTHEKLLEATEKIRKYKERLDSMNDYKEALDREQDAHNKSVDECVRLQKELNILQPLKRQLEEYKNRALETEVQLAECKDALVRLERERDELDGARNDIMKEAHDQRAQAEELRKFIRLEERQGDEPGIGEGISELNPELHEELTKLRSENERLRDFAEQRTDDAVQKLQENLEDSNTLQERFKEEYLKSKNNLEHTESLLSEAKQKLAELEVDIEKKDLKAQDYEDRLGVLEDHYTACLEDLEGLQENIETCEEEKQALEYDLAEWKKMADKLESELKARASDLDDTRKELRETEETKAQVETALAEWKSMVDKLEKELQRRVDELDETKQTLGVTEEEKAQVESSLAEWKLMAEKLEAELMRGKEVLEANQQKLSSTEEEKGQLEGDLEEWKQMADRLEAELKLRSEDLDETKKQLGKTQEMLHANGKRQEELLNRIDVYEKKLAQAEEDNDETSKELKDSQEALEKTEAALREAEQELLNRIDVYQKKIAQVEEENDEISKELKDTQEALEKTEAALRDAEQKETAQNEEFLKLREVSDQLVTTLREEKRVKKEMIEEHHKTLEATREVLHSKAEKEQKELQANMNKLLSDERKALRLHKEKTSVDFKKHEDKYKRKLHELKSEAESSMKATVEEHKREMQDLQARLNQEKENAIKELQERHEKKLERGIQMLNECTQNAKESLLEEVEKRKKLQEDLDNAEEINRKQQSKNEKLKKTLAGATSKIDELEQDEYDLNDRIQKLEREKSKLEEQIDTFKRQLGGSYGADGQLQNQVERLSKELADSQKDNRELKKKLAQMRSGDVSSSFSMEPEQIQEGYSRNGVNQSALTQMKAGYEEELSNMKDEYRELIMKVSAANMEAQKERQICWDRNEECNRLRAENTSLQLQLQRAQLAASPDENLVGLNTSIYSQVNESSFYSGNNRDVSFAADTDRSFSIDVPQNKESQKSPLGRRGDSSNDTRAQLSPPTRVLTPSRRHANAQNAFSERTRENYSAQAVTPKSNPYKLNLENVGKKSSERNQSMDRSQHSSIVDATRQPGSPIGDHQPECNQS